MNRAAMNQTRPPTGSGSSGSALLVVLIMLGAIAVLAAIASRSVSGAALEMSNARAAALSETDLRAGIELGVAAILKLGDTMRSADADADLTNRHLSVHITNERARIDLNAAPKNVLAALLKANGIDENEAESLASAVRDWRGGSASQQLAAPSQPGSLATHIPGFGGFDTPIGETADGRKQTIGTRYFFHPTQLASVPGFSKQLVRSILPLLTLANGSNQIDPFIASRGVLEALPDMTQSKVDGFMEARDGKAGRDTALLLLGLDKKLVTDTAAAGWRLEIVSTSRSTGRSLRREAVIAVGQGDDRPFRVLYADDPEAHAIASGERGG
jgi:general secretion pathway protein K